MTAPVVFNLGTLISSLGSVPSTAAVTIDGTYGQAPSHPHSYRGYYEDLAFAPSDEPITASEFLVLIGSALGPMVGYKGGDYTVNMRTVVWVAEHGNTGARIIDTAFDEATNTLSLVMGDED